MDDKIAAGKKVLTNVFYARLCVRRSRSVCDQFHMNLSNGHVDRSREQPMDIVEANMQIEHYCSFIINSRKKTDEAGSSQHLLK